MSPPLLIVSELNVGELVQAGELTPPLMSSCPDVPTADVPNIVELMPYATPPATNGALLPVPPLATAKVPPKTMAPAVGVDGVSPVVPPLNVTTPALATVIVPLPFVTLMPVPAVSVFNDKPLPLPMSNWPLVAPEVLMPVPPLAAGNTPMTPVVRLMAGMSAATSERNVGMPAEPFGAAKTVFADSLASTAVSVPVEVTGLFDTEKMLGNARPTLETLPDAAMMMLPAPLVIVTFVPAVSVFRLKPEPSPMSSCPFAAAAVSSPVPPQVVGKIPLTPDVKLMSGMSAAIKERKTGVPLTPFGAANTVFADSLASVAVNVPVVVTGLPDTMKMLGSANPTLVTASAEVKSVPVVGNVTFVGPVVVIVNALVPDVVNEPPVMRLPPSVIVLLPLLTPVPPLAAFNTPPSTTAPMLAMFGVSPVVPPLQLVTPLFAIVMVPAPLVTVMAVDAVMVFKLKPLPLPINNCPFAAADALTPVPPFAAGSTPETPVARLIVGMSAATNVRKLGVPAEPFGAAKTVLATWLLNVAVSVPVVVTGVPVTVKMLGSANPTLVTASADVNNVPLVGTVTLVGPVVVMVSALLPDVVNVPPVTMLPPSVMVLLPLLTPVPPLEAFSTPAMTTAPLAAVLGVKPVIPALQLVTPLLAMEMVPGPLVTVMAVPPVIVLRDSPLPFPIRSCPLVAPDVLSPVPPFAAGRMPMTPVAKLMAGMSAATSVRNVGVPDEPLGAAKTVLALSLLK